MRHLHARHADGGQRSAGAQAATDARRSGGCAGRRAVPLHRLSEDRRGGAGRRRGRRRSCATAASAPARAKVDGLAKLTGRGKLWRRCHSGRCAALRVVRSPHPRATFTLGDLEPFVARAARPGARADRAGRAGQRLSACIPPSRTRRCWPTTRCAIAASRSSPWSATRAAIEAIRDDEVPIRYEIAAADRRHRGGEAGRSAARRQGRQRAGRWRRHLRRCRGGAGRSRACGRNGIPDQLRRACLYRARGRLGRAQGRCAGNPRLHPESVPASRRRGADPETRPKEAVRLIADRLRRRLRRQARPQRPSAAGIGRVAHGQAGGLCLYPAREHGGLDQAASGAGRVQDRLRRARQARRLLVACGIRYRRLCQLGPDRRQPRAGPCAGAVCRAAREDARHRLFHQLPAVGRLSRLRRAAERHRQRGGDGRAGRPAGPGLAGVPPHQRAAPGRCHHHRAGAATIPSAWSRPSTRSSPYWRDWNAAAKAFNAAIVSASSAASASAVPGTAWATRRSATRPR